MDFLVVDIIIHCTLAVPPTTVTAFADSDHILVALIITTNRRSDFFAPPPPNNKPAPMPALFLLTFSLLTLLLPPFPTIPSFPHLLDSLTFPLFLPLLPPSLASASAPASALPRAIELSRSIERLAYTWLFIAALNAVIRTISRLAGRKRAPGWGWDELGSGLGLHLLAWRLLKLPTSTSANGGGWGYPFDVCTAVGVGAGMISLGGEVLDMLDI